MSECYLDPRVSRKALNAFFAKFPPEHDEIHALEIFHHDAMVLRAAVSPYSPTDKREIYSLSKSFTSTAIGFLVDAGKLSLEDYIVDLFPDKLPENPSENLKKMKLRHVLSMNCGHPSCVMHKMIHTDDAARAFLAEDVPFEPGTHFAYNTGATFFLSCIVERITGMKLLDFLTAKLFMPLGVTDVRWNQAAEGVNEGGTGIHVCIDDIAKLGLLYLHKGVWNGKRLLSEEWVRTATSAISDNSGNGTPDWCAGYGFQFWRMAKEGFRGDGAYGQLCIVLPETDMVIAVQTELGDMQREVDAVLELAAHLFDEDPMEPLILPDYAPIRSDCRVAGLENRFYRFDANKLGWTGGYFTYDPAADAMRFTFSNGVDQNTIAAGAGYWCESMVVSPKLKPKLVDIMPTWDMERCRIAASYTAEPGKITFSIRYLNSPHRAVFTFTGDAETMSFHIESWGKHDINAVNVRGTRLS